MKCQMLCKQRREQAELTVEQAAEIMGISSRTLNRYESGEYEIPEDILITMAKAYGDPLLPWNYWASMSRIAKYYGMRPFKVSIHAPVQGATMILQFAAAGKEKAAFAEAV